MYRDNTRKIKIGNRYIGGGSDILIQSMTNTKTEDVAATVSQIKRLEKAGCEIIRCAVPTMEAAKALSDIKKEINIPLVADIHFDYRLAIAAIEAGADKISKFFGSQALDLVASVIKCDFSRLNGIDFTSVCYIGNNFAVFI